MDRILNILEDGNYTANEIASKLGLSVSETKRALSKLEDDLVVYMNRKSKYGLIKNSKYKVGVVTSLDDGSGYVLLDDFSQIRVSQRDMHCARNDDTVCVEITNKNIHDIQKDLN